MSVEMVSLVVATRQRTLELRRLLDSLLAQTYTTFEVILVDQNEDERLLPVAADYNQKLLVRHVRSASRGKAAANNVGLRLCEGDVVGFPDDDCWYSPDLLERLVAMFANRPEWDAITGCEAPAADAVRSDRFDRAAGTVTQDNIWRRHISFAVFFRTQALSGLIYDERLGIGAGTIWGSGEETDFLLRFLKRGHHVEYCPSLVIFHPDFGKGPYTPPVIAKARRYGMGMGRILQDHGFSAALTLKCFCRPLLGGFSMLLLGRPRKAAYHWAIFLGRTGGWITSLVSNQTGSHAQTPTLSAK